MSRDSRPKLTVLHLFSGDLWAGAEVMVFNLLNVLKEYPDIKLIAFSMNKGTLTEKLRSLEIETHVFPEDRYSFWKIWLEALKSAKGKNISIIHSHRYKENLLAFLLGRCLGIKHTVTTLHGLPECLSSNPRKTDRLNYFLIKYLFSRVIAVSQDIKKVLIEKYNFKPGRVALVYNGINTSIPIQPRSAKSNVSDSLHIGTVGRMVPIKDFELFLQIAVELKKLFKKIRFSILGEGPLKENLMKYSLKLGVPLEFAEPVANPFPFYQSLDLYLNTSLHEGIPLTILEAMACGLPVVAPRVGGIPEIIDHNQDGFLFEDRDPVKIAQTCRQFLLNGRSKEKMGMAAKRKIQDSFSAEAMAENYYQKYLSLYRQEAA